MEFIESEASVSRKNQVFSDSENEEMNLDDGTIDENNETRRETNENEDTDEIDNFIDNTPQSDENDVSFYREINNMNRFPNQTKKPQNASFEQDYPLCETGDLQPELYDPISRNLVVFDRIEGSEKYVERFKKTMRNFGDSENQFFEAVIYSVMFHKSNGEILDQTRITEVLGEDFCNDLLDVKDKIKLDRTIFGFFDRCTILNEIFSKYNFFVKFFKRRDKFRVIIKKKVVGKK